MKKMKAAVLHEIGKPLVIEELDVPDPQYGQVQVKVKASGLCHKQLEEITGKRGEDPYLPHLLGHEGAGIVEEVGLGVTCVKPGDHVVLGWMKGQGIDAEPPVYTAGGRTLNAGCITTFNEYAVVSENRVTRMDERMPFAPASLLGCAVTTGLGVVKRIAQMESHKSVAVFGIGGIGLNVVQAAALCSASAIYAVDINDAKLGLASRLGATHVINAEKENPVERIWELNADKGVDYAFEAAGNLRVMEQAYEVTGAQGLTTLIGVPPIGEKMHIDPIPLYLGRRLTGCHGGDTVKDEDIPYCVDMYLQGKLQLDELITERIALEEINDGFARMQDRSLIGRSVIDFDNL